jgi:hypothetical protein
VDDHYQLRCRCGNGVDAGRSDQAPHQHHTCPHVRHGACLLATSAERTRERVNQECETDQGE